MRIVTTKTYNPLNLTEGQTKQLPSTQRIQDALKGKDCLGFYLEDKGERIGFALIRQWEEGAFFLWAFLVDQFSSRAR
ncbi:MAG: hypothetical protein FWD97_01930 [Defluviitaleaceae bacterium]|nr:hypothetical protein [Defluviitaleaceae bacterium]